MMNSNDDDIPVRNGTFRYCSHCNLPTQQGVFEMRVYKNDVTGVDAIAMVARVKHGGFDYSEFALPSNFSPPLHLPEDGVFLRIQDQCMTSEIFGSVKCDCKQQLDYSMQLLSYHAKRHYEKYVRRNKRTSNTFLSDSPATVTIKVANVISEIKSIGSAEEDINFLGKTVESTENVSTAIHQFSEKNSNSSYLYNALPREGTDAESLLSSFSSGSSDEEIVGIIVYLLQEGRGVGIASKVKAYSLQEGRIPDVTTPPPQSVSSVDNSGVNSEQSKFSFVASPKILISGGLDTVDANRALGLSDDTREYFAVADIMKDLNLPVAPYLLTNNPRKIKLLNELNVATSGVVPIQVQPVSKFAADYMKVKAQRMGHMLDSSVL